MVKISSKKFFCKFFQKLFWQVLENIEKFSKKFFEKIFEKDFLKKVNLLWKKTFAQNHFTMKDHFTMMDWSTMQKTFANGRLMHLQRIFHYGDFALYY